MIKQYEKKYENFYTGKRTMGKCRLDKVSTDIGLDANEYISLIKEKFGEFENTLFDLFVRHTWIIKRFCYKGVHRKKYFANGYALDSAFGVFMRKYAGFDNKLFNGQQYFKIISYLDDFFPEFDLYNPFEEPERYKYPYKNVKLCHLFVVAKMEERLELLQYVEEKNMVYPEFVDYVINYAMSYNEEIGRDKYILCIALNGTPYIKNVDIKNKFDTIKIVSIKKK